MPAVIAMPRHPPRITLIVVVDTLDPAVLALITPVIIKPAIVKPTML
jgi:hypothetical protein